MYRFGPKFKNGLKLTWQTRHWEDGERIDGYGVVLMSLVGRKELVKLSCG